jgi:asparagine synthetase B (glutamine-hydrolysing)
MPEVSENSRTRKEAACRTEGGCLRSLFGFLLGDRDVQEETSRRMFDGLVQRGGDTLASWTCGDLFIGLRGARRDVGQALITNADQTVVAAIEGEIYDNGGDRAQTITDLYEKHGLDFARHLNGVFGIALFDSRRKRLLLVRDHLGSHSLFYAGAADRVAFATTIRAILQSGIVAGELSTDGMNAYFASTTIPAPGTMFNGIYCVRPVPWQYSREVSGRSTTTGRYTRSRRTTLTRKRSTTSNPIRNRQIFLKRHLADPMTGEEQAGVSRPKKRQMTAPSASAVASLSIGFGSAGLGG